MFSCRPFPTYTWKNPSAKKSCNNLIIRLLHDFLPYISEHLGRIWNNLDFINYVWKEYIFFYTADSDHLIKIIPVPKCWATNDIFVFGKYIQALYTSKLLWFVNSLRWIFSNYTLKYILYIHYIYIYNIHDKRTIAAENTYFWMFHLGIRQQWPMLINMHVAIWYN